MYAESHELNWESSLAIVLLLGKVVFEIQSKDSREFPDFGKIYLLPVKSNYENIAHRKRDIHIKTHWILKYRKH